MNGTGGEYELGELQAQEGMMEKSEMMKRYEAETEGGRMNKLGCDYRGMDFGAGYIDSCCIDGYLWDLDSGDSDSLSIGGDIPCPKCNHDAWIEYIRDDIETQGYVDFEAGKTIEDCPFFAGCSGLRFLDDWEIYRGFWLKGFADAKKEGEDV